MNDAHTFTADELWNAALRDMRLQMIQATFDQWLRGTKVVSLDSDMLTIRVHDQHAKEFIEFRLHRMIQRTVASIAGRAVEVRYVPAEITRGSGI